jgi:hypothetical protein
MRRTRRRKCPHCQALFQADARNRGRQKYCSKPSCRLAAKAARQRRWLAKPENQNYFRDPQNAARARAWQDAHPGYWCRFPLIRELVRPTKLIGHKGLPDVAWSLVSELTQKGATICVLRCAQHRRTIEAHSVEPMLACNRLPASFHGDRGTRERIGTRFRYIDELPRCQRFGHLPACDHHIP